MAGRRRGPADGRAEARRGSARPPAKGCRSRVPIPRRRAACGRHGRTRGGCRCGSPRRLGAVSGSRTRAARPTTRQGRGGRRARPCRGGAPCPPCGRARRSRPVGRSAERVRARRAPPVRRPRGCRRSQDRSFEREQPPLESESRRPVSTQLERLAPPCGDDAVAWNDEREAALRAEAARRPRRPRPAGERGEAAVGDDLSPWNSARRGEQRTLELREPVVGDGHVVVATGVPSRCAPNRRHRSDTNPSPTCDGLRGNVISGVLAPPLGGPG